MLGFASGWEEKGEENNWLENDWVCELGGLGLFGGLPL